MSVSAATVAPMPGKCARQFMGMSRRNSANPACISALTTRAMARAAPSSGHSLAAGKRSARYSQIASDSHRVASPSWSTGTLPAGEWARISGRVVGRRSRTCSSSNAAPVCLSAIQPLSDHDE